MRSKPFTRAIIHGAAAVLACASMAGAQVNLLLNEIYASHSGTDDREFIELCGSGSLNNIGVIIVDGDGASAGNVDRAWNLSGNVMPADGFFVLGDDAVANLDFSVGAGNSIENGTGTFVLIDFTGLALPAIGTDLDTDNDGVMETPFSTFGTVLDIVAMIDSGANDRTYGGAIAIGPDGTFFPAGILRPCDCPNAWDTAQFLDFDDVANANLPRTPGISNWCPAACCLDCENCADVSEQTCIDMGGDPQGSGTTCAAVTCTTDPCCGNPDPCACVGCPECCNPPGPAETCCFPGGGCTDLAPACCLCRGGVPIGSVCMQPEACCLPNGQCFFVEPRCCSIVFGGQPQGPGTTCTVEACCFPDGSCQDLDPLCACPSLGGQPGGPDTVCPPTTQEEAVLAAHGITTPVDCGPQRRSVVPNNSGILLDPWISEAGTTTSQTFNPPIAADFFASGSEPFGGTVTFRGVPLGFPGFENADTLIARSADPFGRCDFPSTVAVTVEIHVHQLSLESVAPITVAINGVDSQWDVAVDLSQVPQPPGTLTVTAKTHCNGGTYTSELQVLPRFTFTRVAPPNDVRVLDTGLEGLDPIILASPPGVEQPWVHDPLLTLAIDYASAFHPGLVPASIACGDFDTDNDTDDVDFATLLGAFGRSVGEAAYLPVADFERDGTVTFVDYQEWLCCYRCFIGNPLAPPPRGTLGDFDADGDVDLLDFRRMQQCVAGLPESDFACVMKFDFDGNGAVDLDDFGAFAEAFSSP